MNCILYISMSILLIISQKWQGQNMHKSEKMDFTEMSLKIEIIIISYSLSFHCVLTPGLCGCVCAHLCPTLCHPMDYSPPGSSVHGFSQARILERVTISYSRGSSWPKDWTCVFYVSRISRWILYHSCHRITYYFIFSAVLKGRSC